MRALLVIILIAFAAPASAQSASDRILGEWWGQSTCTNREAAPNCHDEYVHYVFTAANGGYHAVADRIEGANYARMGELDFTYSPSEARWTSTFTSPACEQCVWWYRIEGVDLAGGLTDKSGQSLRSVSAARQP